MWARGLDVQQVSLVINYDLPNSRELYIHRLVATCCEAHFLLCGLIFYNVKMLKFVHTRLKVESYVVHIFENISSIFVAGLVVLADTAGKVLPLTLQRMMTYAY